MPITCMIGGDDDLAPSPSCSLNVQVQKGRGAGDTGVIVADRLLALPGQLLFRYIFVLLEQSARDHVQSSSGSAMWVKGSGISRRTRCTR